MNEADRAAWLGYSAGLDDGKAIGRRDGRADMLPIIQGVTGYCLFLLLLAAGISAWGLQ